MDPEPLVGVLADYVLHHLREALGVHDKIRLVVVGPGDAEALTKALRGLIADADERRRLGANGRRWVEAWMSPAAVAESYERLFDELISARSR